MNMAARRDYGKAGASSTSRETAAIDTGDYSSAGQSGADPVQETVTQVQQKAGEAVNQARDQAGQLVDQVRQQAGNQLTAQKDTLSNSLKSVALAIRQTGQTLREDDQPMVAQLADQAAERVEQAYRYLGNRELSDLTNDAGRLARRQPALFLGGAFLLGVAAARFLKSSSRMAASGGASGGYAGSDTINRAKVYGMDETAGTTGYYDRPDRYGSVSDAYSGSVTDAYSGDGDYSGTTQGGAWSSGDATTD